MHPVLPQSRTRRTIVVTMLAFPLTSCALAGRLQFERPTVELQAVQITGLGLSGGSLKLQLEVFNPNAYDIRTTRVAAGLALEDTHFGDALLEESVLLASESRTTVDVPIRFTWAGLGAGARALLQTGTVVYALDSRISFDTPVGERALAFRNTGSVPLREMFR